MCGRFTLRTPAETIANLFQGLTVPELKPSYNVAPTHPVAAIRNSGGDPHFAWLRWGLIPSWADDKKIGSRMINARAESVSDKPAYRSPFRRRRCLIPADGFYEWRKTADGKCPMYITMRDERPFCMAGLWEVNDKLDEMPLESCTIITTSANPLLAPIHDRMPVILPVSRCEMWLDPVVEDSNILQELLAPFDCREMTARPVSKIVGNVRHNSPECIEPVSIQREFGF